MLWGGVSSVHEAKKIVELGAEKVAFSSAAINDTSILEEVGKIIGMQSVVVVLDYKDKGFLKERTFYS